MLTQRADEGGFRGREGDADLYYTGFAVRTLTLTDGLDAGLAADLAVWLKTFDVDRLDTIDLLSWLYTAVVVAFAGGPNLADGFSDADVDRLAAGLESRRRDDGGYAKSADGARGSTYHSFLTLLAYQLLGKDVPGADRLVRFLFDMQRDDGGFVEIAPMRRGGTNPTAAAAASLHILGKADDELREDVAGFLGDVKADGGFRANTRIPFADGLSTFTALLTCRDLGLDVIGDGTVRSFVAAELERPGGGCSGASWDETPDVEYTFYGVGLLALTASRVV